MRKGGRVMTNVLIRRETGGNISPWDELNRLYDQFLGGPHYHVRQEIWHPEVDVYDRSDKVVVEVELPGVDRKDVDLSVEEDHLVIQGSRSRQNGSRDDERGYSERYFGAFHRVVHLPASVDTAASGASVENGVLTVTLPKSEKAGTKKIEIK